MRARRSRRSTPTSSSSARARAARSPRPRSRAPAARSRSSKRARGSTPTRCEPFSLEEMVAKYRHGGSCAALGRPGDRVRRGPVRRRQHRDQQRPLPPAPARARRGVAARLPDRRVRHRRRSTATRSASRRSSASRACPGAPPASSAVLERGATKLGWRSVEFSRVFRYEPNGRAVKQTMARTLLPERDRGRRARRRRLPGVAARAPRRPRSSARRASRRCPTARRGRCSSAPTTCSCARARPRRPRCCSAAASVATSAAGLKMHPTVKIAARFDSPIDHGDVPMHRVTEFAPGLTIGGSASRRGHVALALADSDADYADALARLGARRRLLRRDPQRGLGPGASRCPGFRSPLVTYQLTEGDMSRLARALVHLGEVLLAAGATELYPSVTGGVVARGPDDLVQWWDALTRNRANLMTVHLTSTVRIGENRRAHRRRQLRPGVGLRQPAGERRVAAARRARASTRRARSWPSRPATPTSSSPTRKLRIRTDRQPSIAGIDRDRGQHHERRFGGGAKARARVRDDDGHDHHDDRREQRVQRRRTCARRRSTTAPAIDSNASSPEAVERGPRDPVRVAALDVGVGVDVERVL